MYGKDWKTSDRKFKVLVEHGVRIKITDGVELDADVFRPDTNEERFPAILGAHPYNKSGQLEPIKVNSTSGLIPHAGEERPRGSLEAGDPYFYARRGYVHIIANLRGTGKSGGYFTHLGKREVQDVYEMIQWVAKQPWCNESVGMFGVSYFAMIQLLVAGLNPPHLKCLFAPWGSTDPYRDMYYHGGILSARWTLGYPRTSLSYGNVRPISVTKEEEGKEGLSKRIAAVLADEDISGVPELVEVLNNPDRGLNQFVIDVLVHPDDDSYWEERRAKLEKINIPCYLGADWAVFHLPSAFRNWEKIRAPKKMIIGPLAYLDRPLYQLQYESLRWFDYWLKGMDNGIMDEPPIRLFVNESGQWKSVQEWPLPETKWTPFFIHENNLLSEREYWPNEGSDSYFDSPWSRGFLEYHTPALVEETEVIGQPSLTLFASTTDNELLWSIRILEVDKAGNERIASSGWLRGSLRRIDGTSSKPWSPYHPYKQRSKLEPGRIYEFRIGLLPLFSNNYFAGW
ncbi:MAG: CocE/NonD family hydrolase [Nitrososphaerales archaeon]